MRETSMQDSLIKHLSSEISQSRKLLALLEKEGDVLKTPNSDQITALASEKQALLQELESIIISQDQFLVSHGFAKGKDGIEKMLMDFGEQSPAASHWKELQTLTQTCKDLNEINGGIVAAARRHIEQSLEILRGSAGSENLYGASGQTRSGSQSNVIGKA